MKGRVKEQFNLHIDQASNSEIRRRIDDGASVAGANIYILIFAILIASVGLNMNSTAVVIGAMLISPLMGVLMSISYGISNQEFPMLKRSMYKFVFQVGVSIITSTIYFWLSPMDTFSGELAARTNPTLWDALIAFFGGFAAVIATTRKSQISNVLPGAAIATALMPPLCTVGYCIASAKWISALEAFYLFVINVIFICLSSVIGLRIMKVTSEEELVKTKKDRVILALIFAIAIIPSGFLAAQTVQENYKDSQYHEFLQSEFDFDDTQIVKSDIDNKDKKINVVLIGNVLDKKQVDDIEKSLPEYGLSDYKMNIIQTHINDGISKSELESMIGDKEIGEKAEEDMDTQKLLELQTQSNELQTETVKELLILYPKVKSAGFIDLYSQDGTKYFSLMLIVDNELEQQEMDNLKKWVETKFDEQIEVVQLKDNR